MLKRVLVFLVIVGCVSQFCAGINSYAREVNDSNAVVEQVYEDGSYIESTVVLDSQVGYARSSTVSGKRNILIKFFGKNYLDCGFTWEFHLQWNICKMHNNVCKSEYI